MTSFQISLTPNRRAAARFIGQIRRALQMAYVEEQTENGLSQSEIARALKVHRSVINRELKGLKDITAGRIAELAWAMGRKPAFTLEKLEQRAETNHPASAPNQVNANISPPSQMRTLANGFTGIAVAG
jgi:plasmid maintenance system antidote protein VapI